MIRDVAAPDFIEVYPDALAASDCRAIIDYFERSGQAVRGATGSGVNLALKDSWDIEITGRADWKVWHDAIQTAAFAGLRRYVLAHPYTMLAPLSFNYAKAAGETPISVSADNIAALPHATLDRMLQHAFRPGNINVQKYLADQGGYPYWHCEHYPRDATADSLHRVLLYTIYLNDGFGAGETEFIHQQKRIKPVTGSLLIAPAFFTHTHRGNRPSGGDKYIATSWILFNRAELLFPARSTQPVA